MEKLDKILHESKEAEFTVVTIATELAAAETKRLLMSLQDDNIAVRRVIINQVIQQQTLENPNDYLTKIRQGQKSSINELENIANTNEVPLVIVPYFDTEVRTVYGLRVIGNTIFSKK
jgi:anion-transporting  ArsA/GET3 family ATPase